MNWNQKTLRHCSFALAAISALCLPAWAQQQNIRTVTRYRVKTDRVGDLQAAIKEFNGVLQKGGSERRYTIWSSQSGPNEYLLVRYYTKWAELDVTQDPKLKEHAADLTRIGSRILQCTESSERLIEEVLPDLSSPRSMEIPKMISVLRSRVRPDKADEYLALVKSDLLPALKKAELKSYSVARVRYGAPRSEFISATGLNSWADLDGTSPIVKAMGEESYQRYLAKVRPLLLEAEYNVYRFMPDLSYLPGAGGTTSSN